VPPFFSNIHIIYCEHIKLLYSNFET
jgi:hypothetical protein